MIVFLLFFVVYGVIFWCVFLFVFVKIFNCFFFIMIDMDYIGYVGVEIGFLYLVVNF